MTGPVQRVWTTADVSPAERFDYWGDAICAAYVRLDAAPVEGAAAFAGSVSVQDWLRLRLSHVVAGGHRVRRRPDDGTDDCLVSIQVRGQGGVRQGGLTASLTPGTLALYDAQEQYALDFEDAFEQVVVQFPRTELAARGLDPREVAGRRCDGGMARVSAALVSSAMFNAHELTPSGRSHLSGQLLDCLSAALASGKTMSGKTTQVDGQTARNALRHAVVTLVHEHLTDPALSVELVARTMHCSPRTLQRLFVDQPHGLGELMRRGRLDGATEALIDPARADHTIARIAAEHGYADATHFARVFRERHGCSPSEHRYEQALRTDG